MIETKDQREARLKAEAASREANIRRYESKMKVELPYSPVAVVERPVVEVNVNNPVNVNSVSAAPIANVNKVDRKAYMLDYMKKYRKREKKCPHCGEAL